MTEEPFFIPSSGNVFADFGLPDADEMLEKAHLALKMKTLLRERGMSETEFGRKLAVDEAEVSNIMRGRIRPIPIEVLQRYVGALQREEAT